MEGKIIMDREPARWITVKGKHLPVYADGTIGIGQENPPQDEKTLKQQSIAWYNNLSDKEKFAIGQMQIYVGGKTWDANSEKAKIVDSALSKFTLKQDIVAYRGVGLEEFTNVYLAIDKTTSSPKSTSYDERTATNFAQNQGGYIIEYHVKAGNVGADVNGVTRADEHEFLIRQNMPQKVVKKVGKNKLIVEVG